MKENSPNREEKNGITARNKEIGEINKRRVKKDNYETGVKKKETALNFLALRKYEISK